MDSALVVSSSVFCWVGAVSNGTLRTLVSALQLLHVPEDGPLQSTPLWARPGLTDERLVQEFRRECRIIRKGMDGDLVKVRMSWTIAMAACHYAGLWAENIAV